MKVVLLGASSRMSAIAWKLLQSPSIEKIYFLPGNATYSPRIENINIDPSDHNAIYDLCKREQIDYIVTGNAGMLERGIVDYFDKKGIKIYGPTKAASKLEWSKTYAKEFMQKYSIPSAGFKSFDNYETAKKYILDGDDMPLVIKADGLIAGRGVAVCSNKTEALSALDKAMHSNLLKNAASRVLIEERIEGPEASVHVISDGKNYKIFPLAQDHKPLLEGNKGPNTGGMGTYAPLDWVSQELMDELEEKIIKPTLQGLASEGIEFKGTLFPGIMFTKNGPMVLEYNTRFGAPETQTLMKLMKSDLNELFLAVIDGKLDEAELSWHDGYAATVEVVGPKYPEHYDYGTAVQISVLDDPDVNIFHGATIKKTNGIVTNGGKIFSISAVGNTLEDTLSKIYHAARNINFDGMFYRKDIGRLKNIITSRNL